MSGMEKSDSAGLLGNKPEHWKKAMGEYERDSLLTYTISQLVTMVMNGGAKKHAVFDRNKLSDQGLWYVLPTHTYA